jgi:hypothetical protein
MKHDRVWYTLLPQPRSPWSELLCIHHVAKGDGVDGVEGATGSGSGSVSLPILAVLKSVLCILCFSAAPSRNRLRGLYIVGFRSRQVCGVQDCIKTHKAWDGPTTRPGSGDAWWALFCASSRSPLTSSHGLLFPKKWRGKNIVSVWYPKGP